MILFLFLVLTYLYKYVIIEMNRGGEICQN